MMLINLGFDQTYLFCPKYRNANNLIETLADKSLNRCAILKKIRPEYIIIYLYIAT